MFYLVPYDISLPLLIRILVFHVKKSFTKYNRYTINCIWLKSISRYLPTCFYLWNHHYVQNSISFPPKSTLYPSVSLTSYLSHSAQSKDNQLLTYFLSLYISLQFAQFYINRNIYIKKSGFFPNWHNYAEIHPFLLYVSIVYSILLLSVTSLYRYTTNLFI